MNKKISVVLLMGLMLLISADAWAQPQVSDLFATGLPAMLTLDADETIELQWVQGAKEFAEEIVARAGKVFMSGEYFTAQYRGFEVTPIVGSGLYGVNFSYKW